MEHTKKQDKTTHCQKSKQSMDLESEMRQMLKNVNQRI